MKIVVYTMGAGRGIFIFGKRYNIPLLLIRLVV